MPAKQPDPIYSTDDFPRDGCTLVIDVQRNGFYVQLIAPGISVFPQGGSHPAVLDRLFCKTSEQLEKLVLHMAVGDPLPEGYTTLGFNQPVTPSLST